MSGRKKERKSESESDSDIDVKESTVRTVFQDDLVYRKRDAIEFPNKDLRMALRTTFPDKKDRAKARHVLKSYLKTSEAYVKEAGEPHDEPIFIVMYGPPGSGKSSIRDKILGPLLGVHEYVNVNVDDIVEDIPAYKTAAKQATKDLLDPGTQERVEKEMTALYFKFRKAYGDVVSNNLVHYALDNGYNVLFETTGSSLDWTSMIIRQALKSGYKTVVIWPLTDLSELETRVLERARRTGRVVTRDAIVSIYKNASANFFRILPMVDHVYLLDNNEHVKSVFQSLLMERHVDGQTIESCSYALQKVSLYNVNKDEWDHECTGHWTLSTEPTAMAKT